MPVHLQKVNDIVYQKCDWSGRLLRSAYGYPKQNGREGRFADAACAVAYLTKKYTDNNNEDGLLEVLNRIYTDLNLQNGEALKAAPELSPDNYDYSYRTSCPWMHRPSIYISADQDQEDHLKLLESKRNTKNIIKDPLYVYAFSFDADKVPNLYELEREKIDGIVFDIKGQSSMKMIALPVSIPGKNKQQKTKYVAALSFGSRANENKEFKKLIGPDNTTVYIGTIYVFTSSIFSHIKSIPNTKALIEKTNAAEKADSKASRKKRGALILDADLENFIKSKIKKQKKEEVEYTSDSE